ncbi:nitroreductase family protein [Moritella viscosa]|uniref:Nitroreductase family protein n=1 Tax=Moritella viscosa TaxID=80854 RepID=A0A1L0ARK9_9GAMM|nr:nitroreductase family protein [Moritella viscosa]SGY85390.1 Nitroreductase family protein [Moritella viscosa]SGY86020.1 Nitroreductase family protein [Moritella viscosa]SGY86395.1 Nitroreductase family protein [Moritella viscosa]SGY87680.1 Nitroreductase family protein [Moritella viscosa]SGZ18439.1 Nitroreductase family protein [Moritella viscosa]
MTHQIIKDLSHRYTTKKFDSSKKISQDQLAVVMEAMRLSASSINSQPWKFIVIESDEAKQRMYNTFANKFQFNQPHVFSASHIIIFAHNPAYTRANYEAVIDKGIADKRTKPEDKEGAFGAFAFVELNTDEHGNTAPWTKAQTYLALGNTMHTLARLNIDSTPMEGIDSELISKEFAVELDGYVSDVALAIGYRDAENDYNIAPPKSRLAMEDVMVKI